MIQNGQICHNTSFFHICNLFGIEKQDITDIMDVTDVTDIADVTDVTNITDVAGVTDITGGTVRHMA